MLKRLAIALSLLALPLHALADPNGGAFLPGNAGSQSQLAGCIYRSGSISPITGQQMGVACDSAGAVIISGSTGGGASVGVNGSAGPTSSTQIGFQDNSGNLQVPSNSNPLPVSGTFSNAAFVPLGTATLSVSTSSSNVLLGSTGPTAVVYNTGSNAAYIKFGNSAVTATTSNYLVQAGWGIAFSNSGNNYIAGITASGSTNLTITTGTGIPALTSGSGGGSGGAVTIASGGVASGAYASGSYASGAFSGGAFAPGSLGAGAGVAGALLDLDCVASPVSTSLCGLVTTGNGTLGSILTAVQAPATGPNTNNADAVATSTNNLGVNGFDYLWNGTTWDRWPGSATTGGRVYTQAATTGGASTYSAVGGTSNAQIGGTAVSISSGVHSLYHWSCSNNVASAVYIQFFDATSVTLGTTVPKLSYQIPASGIWEENYPDEIKVAFATGLMVAVTTTATGATGPATGANCNFIYK